MTTTITVKPAHHHVLVSCTDQYVSPGGLVHYGNSQEVLKPLSPERTFYSTTTRTYTISDLEPNDARAMEADGTLNKAGLGVPYGGEASAAAAQAAAHKAD